MSVNALMISADILKDRMAIHDNLDEKLIYPDIKVAQDMYIHPILGSALYDKIVSDINVSGTTSGAYKTLLDNYIIDALCYYTMSRLPVGISYQFWNKGVVRKIGDNTDLPDMTDLISISDRYLRTAEWYGERLTKYLQQNATSTVLPEYITPGNGIDTIIPEVSAFTMPIYLGDFYDPSLDKDNKHPINRTNQNDL
jgi:hypothetical protein